MEIQKLVSRATNMMFEYPHISAFQKGKNWIKKLLGKSVYVPNCIGWPNGLCALGLIEQIKVNPDSSISKKDITNLKSYFDNWIRKGATVSRVEDFISGYVLMELIDILDSVGEPVNEEYEKAVHSMYNHLIAARTDEQGSFVYVPNMKNNYIFADMIGMVCPFLAKYGVKYDAPQAIGLCIKQIDNFLNNAIDEATKLPYHCYEYHKDSEISRLGLVGWGRAVGWIMMGLRGAKDELKSFNENEANRINDKLIELAVVVSKYVNDSGLFGWHLLSEDDLDDTSATAMILYSLCDIKDDVRINAMFEKALFGLLQYVQTNGNVVQAQAECLGIGIHPMKFGSFPWSVGPTLAVLSILDSSE